MTPDATPPPGLPAAVITCSDSAAAGAAGDTSGPLAAELLGALGHDVDMVVVVPDERGAIAAAVRAAIAGGARIVATTGGTGAGPRDVTPEALRAAGLRELPGLGEAMRAASRDRVPTADLSRALGGILDGAVVLALPGSPGGVRDGLAAVGGLLAHAAGMAAGGGHPEVRRAAADSGHAQARPAAADSGHAADRPAAANRSGSADRPGSATVLADPVGSPGQVGGDSGTSSADPVGSAGRGGQQVPLVREAPLTEAEVAADVACAGAGAVVTFTGAVRDHDGGRQVTALHYEGHPDADRVLAEVLAEARARTGVLGAAALHRVGDLAIGDLAFVAAVSAAHRAEAFAACAWLVDEAKARLPIWKHQHFADGTDEWVNCP